MVSCGKVMRRGRTKMRHATLKSTITSAKRSVSRLINRARSLRTRTVSPDWVKCRDEKSALRLELRRRDLNALRAYWICPIC